MASLARVYVIHPKGGMASLARVHNHGLAVYGIRPKGGMESATGGMASLARVYNHVEWIRTACIGKYDISGDRQI